MKLLKLLSASVLALAFSFPAMAADQGTNYDTEALSAKVLHQLHKNIEE